MKKFSNLGIVFGRNTCQLAPKQRRDQGFTLIELLVVLSIISLLVGMGIYTLVRIGSSSRLQATAASIRAIIRKAKNTARDEGETSGILYQPERRDLFVIQPTLGAYFHFEKSQIQGVQGGFQVEGGGEASPLGQGKGIKLVKGHLGDGVEFLGPDSGIQFASNPFFSPQFGIIIKVWVLRKPIPANSKVYQKSRTKKVEDQKFFLVQKDESYLLRLTGDGRVEIGLRGKDENKVVINHFVQTYPGIIPENQWTLVEMRFYRGELKLLVHGIPRVLQPIKMAENQKAPPKELEINANPLIIGGGDFPVIIDQLALYIIAESERFHIPKSYDFIIEGAFPKVESPPTNSSSKKDKVKIKAYQVFFNSKGELHSFYHSGPVRFLIGKLQSPQKGSNDKNVKKGRPKTQERKDGGTEHKPMMVWEKVIPIAVDMGGNLLGEEASKKILPGKGLHLPQENRKVK
ncbi:MAG: type II secretion system protein [Planctomycetota bacterium]|nr:MAG: type II secretion system protein [Planctomycetota bacterium]